MKRQPPSLESRRESDFESELLARTRSWIPAWSAADNPQDFGRALLRVAARFSAEVAERLDKVGDKAYRGFFDWLAMRGAAARAARMPVVFKMVDQATDPVLARAPVAMQVDVGTASVNFETENDVQIIPGSLTAIVGTDADKDGIYRQIPGMTTLEPVPPLPTQWRLKSFAAADSTLLQLDPQVGLTPDLIVSIDGLQYRLVTVANDIVTIEPSVPKGAGFDVGTLVQQITAFSPFDGVTRNRQMHALLLGHDDLLNVESPAVIDIVGADPPGTAVTWKYWGKVAPNDAVGWQELTPATGTPPPAGTVRLYKDKGSIETYEVEPNYSARWIAAFAPAVSGAVPLLNIGPLKIAINADRGLPACPLPDPDDPVTINAEAMANTTPIALSPTFYPLGKLPRQFDAFYLGCPEAFGKPNADVQLCFEMSDLTAAVYSVVHGGAFAETVLASVGNDRALHLYAFDATQKSISAFRGRDPLRPPSPASGGIPSTAAAVSLDRAPMWRLPVWTPPGSTDFRVAVAAGSHIWVWAESAADATKSGWIDYGVLPPLDTATPKVSALVYLDDPGTPLLVALYGGGLATKNALTPTAEWKSITPQAVGVAVNLASIAPVLADDGSGRLVTSTANGLFGISAGNPYSITGAGACTRILSAAPPFSTAVQPVALLTTINPVPLGEVPTRLSAVGALTTLDGFVSIQEKKDGTFHSAHRTLANGTIVGGTLEAVLSGDRLTAAAAVQAGANSLLYTFTPRHVPMMTRLFGEPIGVSGAAVGGAPAAIGKNVVVPGNNADVLIGSFDLANRMPLNANIGVGIIVPKASVSLSVFDVVTLKIGNGPGLLQGTIRSAPMTPGEETLYLIDTVAAFPPGDITREVLAYQMTSLGSQANVTTTTTMDFVVLPETRVEAGSTLWILPQSGMHPPYEYVVQSVSTTTVTLATALPVNSGSATFWVPIRTGGRLTPTAEFDPSKASQKFKASLLPGGAFIFPHQDPERQSAQVFSHAGPFAAVAAMGEWWNSSGYPTSPPIQQFVLDAAVGDWVHQAGDSGSNPELSWEYWNGAWSKLTLKFDNTQNLKSTGAIRFKVPTDISASDWSGKTSTWIRARLIGGDYGKESVTVVTKDLGGGVTQQTIERSDENVKPPVVIRLSISYRLIEAVLPTFVLAQDSGTTRDESVANNTEGVSIEAFVPLTVTLGRLNGPGAAASATAVCAADCACPASPTGGTVSSGGATAPAAAAASFAPATGRALFLGFDKWIGGESVNLLFVVSTESNQDQLAPLTVEALVGDHFVPVVVKDGTRAFGETGILTLAFGESPTQVQLFGQTLNWIKITPAQKDAALVAAWNPHLSGVHLNAAWASATETLTRELVGSSQGAPNLSFTLQRPPLLANSLELRVREPLGDDEKKLLLADPNRVIADDNLTGDWVLWKQVDDPGDWEPTDRVYRLDESTGTITFGDGQAGAIPPVGIDSIVAFKYQRTEPAPAGAIDVPANAIEARTTMNLITPLAGVEAAFSADQAAGGALPEPDERVLKFGASELRNRGRAVTAVDLEDLALRSSVAIAQARALVSAQGTRLIVVMRGPDPAPDMSQRRELTRSLEAVTPVAFTAASGLRIEAPLLREVRFSLHLSVDSLDNAGAVAEDVKTKLGTFFDVVAGASSKEGWPLGLSPTADDVALALLDIKHLDSIFDISLMEVLADGSEGPWPAALKANELARLADNPLRLQFDSVEQFA